MQVYHDSVWMAKFMVTDFYAFRKTFDAQVKVLANITPYSDESSDILLTRVAVVFLAIVGQLVGRMVSGRVRNR